MAVLKGNRADVYVASEATPFAAKTFSTTDRSTYKHSISIRLDPATPIEVRRDGVIVSAGEYTIQHAGAKIIFHEAQTVGAAITVSGATLDFMSRVAQGRSWEFSPSVDMEDVTVFGDDWKRFSALQRGGTVSVERFWVDGFFVSELGKPLYLLLYPQYVGASSSRFECVGLLSSDGIQAAASGLIEESAEFTVSGAPVFIE